MGFFKPFKYIKILILHSWNVELFSDLMPRFFAVFCYLHLKGERHVWHLRINRISLRHRQRVEPRGGYIGTRKRFGASIVFAWQKKPLPSGPPLAHFALSTQGTDTHGKAENNTLAQALQISQLLLHNIIGEPYLNIRFSSACHNVSAGDHVSSFNRLQNAKKGAVA